MKNQEKIRIFGQKQDIFKKSGKSQESSTAARPAREIRKKLKRKVGLLVNQNNINVKLVLINEILHQKNRKRLLCLFVCYG